MKIIRFLLGVIFVMTCITIESMSKAAKKHIKEIEIECNKKLMAKRLLQQDIEKIRCIKRCNAKKKAKKRLALNEEFKRALIKNDIQELKKLLTMGIDVNRPLEYEGLKGFNYEYPLVSAAVVYSNLEIVQLLISYGAHIHAYNESSLIYLMIETIADEDSVWINPIDYLAVLYYLLKVSDFDKNRNDDSKKCLLLWQKFLENSLPDEMNFGEESYKLIAKISEQFFSNI